MDVISYCKELQQSCHMKTTSLVGRCANLMERTESEFCLMKWKPTELEPGWPVAYLRLEVPAPESLMEVHEGFV
eukprot:166986-Amphidinium_carterae.1